MPEVSVISAAIIGNALPLLKSVNQAQDKLQALAKTANDTSSQISSLRPTGLDAWTAQLSGIGGSLGGVGSAMMSMAKTATIAAAAISAVVVAGSGYAIKLALDAERAGVAFEVMLGSAEKSKAMLSELRAFANVSPFSLVQVREGAQLLLNYGIAAKDVLPTMRMIGDIAAGDANKMEQLSRAFGQITGVGRLMGQDLNQLINAGFNPLQMISKRTGEEMAALKKRMEDGAVSVDEVRQAMVDATSEGGRFYQMTEKMAATVGGQWSSAMDVIEGSLSAFGTVLLEAFDVQPILKGFNDTFGSLSATIESVSPYITMFADIAKETFKDIMTVIEPCWGLLGDGKAVLAGVTGVTIELGSVTVETFAAMAMGLATVTSTLGITIKGYEYLKGLFGAKVDTTFADSIIEQSNKIFDAANKVSEKHNNKNVAVEVGSRLMAAHQQTLDNQRKQTEAAQKAADNAAQEAANQVVEPPKMLSGRSTRSEWRRAEPRPLCRTP